MIMFHVNLPECMLDQLFGGSVFFSPSSQWFSAEVPLAKGPTLPKPSGHLEGVPHPWSSRRDVDVFIGKIREIKRC